MKKDNRRLSWNNDKGYIKASWYASTQYGLCFCYANNLT